MIGIVGLSVRECKQVSAGIVSVLPIKRSCSLEGLHGVAKLTQRVKWEICSELSQEGRELTQWLRSKEGCEEGGGSRGRQERAEKAAPITKNEEKHSWENREELDKRRPQGGEGT